MSEHLHTTSTAPLPPADHGGDPGITLRLAHRLVAGSPGIVIGVIGDLDRSTAPVLRAAWDAGVESFPGHVLLDLRAVQFCDAAGFRVLDHIGTASRARGLALTMRAGGSVSRWLRLVGLTPEPRPASVVSDAA